MSKRLQVLLPEEEFEALKALAKKCKTTVGEWVRRALRRAAKEQAEVPAYK